MSDLNQQRINQARALSRGESASAFVSLYCIGEKLSLLSEVLTLAHTSQSRLQGMLQLVNLLDEQIWELEKVSQTLCPEPEESN